MDSLCVLSPDINKCPDYDGKGHCLGKTDGCGMLRLVDEKQVVKNEYESKEDKNSNVVNGTQESSRAINKSKIRIMSIIYFILFLCVIVSLIAKGIFVEEN